MSEVDSAETSTPAVLEVTFASSMSAWTMFATLFVAVEMPTETAITLAEAATAIFSALVMIMGGVWFAMHELAGQEASAEPAAVVVAEAR